MKDVWLYRRCWVVRDGNLMKLKFRIIFLKFHFVWISFLQSYHTLFKVLLGKFINTYSHSTLMLLQLNGDLLFIVCSLFEGEMCPLFLLHGKMCLNAFCMMKELQSSNQPFLNVSVVWYHDFVRNFWVSGIAGISGWWYHVSIVVQFVVSIVF